MTGTILSLVLLVSNAQAQSRWQELKTGEQITACFESKAKQAAAPLFGKWITRPAYNRASDLFEAEWYDSVGGNASFRLVTGAPPAMIQCRWVKGEASFSRAPAEGVVCAPTMANGTVYAELVRNVRLSQGQTAMADRVPVMALQGNRLWCTN